MNILGINSVYHDSSAALLVDGKLVVAVEEERFNRIKYGKLPHVDNPHQLPERAIRFCLNYAGLTAGDIDHVAYSFDPQLRRARFRPEWWVDPRFEEVFLLRLGQLRGVADELLGRPLRQRFHFVPHHLTHAASAYYPSGFDRAAILVIDGIGEAAGTTLWKAVGTRIQPVETFDYPHTLGFVWEIICDYLGFSTYDASKLMGLAAYGNPEVFRRRIPADHARRQAGLCGRPGGDRLSVGQVEQDRELAGSAAGPGHGAAAATCRHRSVAAGGHQCGGHGAGPAPQTQSAVRQAVLCRRRRAQLREQ